MRLRGVGCAIEPVLDVNGMTAIAAAELCQRSSQLKRNFHSHILISGICTVSRWGNSAIYNKSRRKQKTLTPVSLDRANTSVRSYISSKSATRHDFSKTIDIGVKGKRRRELQILVLKHQGETIQRSRFIPLNYRSDRSCGQRRLPGIE